MQQFASRAQADPSECFASDPKILNLRTVEPENQLRVCKNLCGGQELESDLPFLFFLEGSDELYYTASDAYTGASAEDAFLQPSSEAMTYRV
jgi:hypothetical protein